MQRKTRCLRDGWKFTRMRHEDALSPACDDSEWQSVRIPHDWAIAGPFDRRNDIDRRVAEGQLDVEKGVSEITGRTGGLPHVGEGWYRRTLDVPESSKGRCFRLECDGIMSHSVVYCNGEKAGSWPNGYTSFAFDLTHLIKPGEANMIAVHVNNPEQSSRWYPGAGIYRNVRLVELNPVHIDHWGIEITTPGITDTHGIVSVKTTVVDRDGQGGAMVRTTILDPKGAPMTTEGGIPAHSPTVEQAFTLDAPVRWTLESPAQYVVRTEVLVAGTVVDSVDTRFGFRTLRFDPELGLFLNDKSVKMKGVCMHHDLGPLGAAVNVAALRRQLTMLKEMGCNAIRTSHNPPAPELPALASEMGILIIDEAFDEWKTGKKVNGYNTLFDDWAEKDLRALIRRDRNHPAVIMWSVGNEIREQMEPQSAETAAFLVDICHDEDPTRPVTCGLNAVKGSRNYIADALDIPGWNYQPRHYGHFHTLFPDKPQYGSETASTVSSRGEYYFPAVDEVMLKRGNLQVNSFDLSYPSWGTAPDIEFQAQDECDFIMGEFVWTGFDYLGEPTPYATEWPSRSSYFGIIDLAGIPKDRYYLYQSTWSNQEVIHLMPHWTWPGMEGKPLQVQCYTSYKSAELFVNGVSQGRKSHYRKHKVLESSYRFHWPSVVYEPGELKVVVYDGDDAVGERTMVTAGEPASIELVSDRDSIRADGDDMAFVTARILDAEGNLCPCADNSVAFELSGPAEIAGLCNGDATSLETFKGPRMSAFNGLCVLYLKSMGCEAGDIDVRCRADGLSMGKAILHASGEERIDERDDIVNQKVLTTLHRQDSCMTSLLKEYVSRFNETDEELYTHVPNSEALEFLESNVPLFECPDKDIERTCYFRWWTYRKHIKQTSDGYVITEFLPEVPWSGKHNTISCPAGHHYYEGRWLRNTRYLDDYSYFWLRKGGEPRLYSFWIANAFLARHMVTPNVELLADLLPDLVKNYQAWETGWDQGGHHFGRHDNGLFYTIDDRDGGEDSIGGHGFRPTLNSYMYGDAKAIAAIAVMVGEAGLAEEFESKAAEIKNLVQQKLWDHDAGFFKILPEEGKPLRDVRELNGYTPWYFNLPDPGFEAAWKQLMDAQGFYAPFGPAFAEQRHPEFAISYKGHECQWNGPSYPMATSIVLTALANLLNNYDQDVIRREDYFETLKIYTRCHQRQLDNGAVVPWIDENINPYTGDWIARTRLKTWKNGTWSRHKGGRERGKDYNHSTYNDLIITGLVGLRPRPDDVLEINPLLPDNIWDYFCLDRLPYHGRLLTIRWDRTGQRYNMGKGLTVSVDGEGVARSETLSRITASLVVKDKGDGYHDNTKGTVTSRSMTGGAPRRSEK
ncbi:MAG: glycoside hydrolase family 2 TIM barrel-domain containing protein [Lentisphaeria bacterium]|nr:glycoside hydrolase family 2 TIM barrel-domain containing protein [Lentisphaeria bacterium]